jgi:epoxyqueuosine reductase QueG
LDIEKRIKKSTKKVGAKLVGFTSFDGESVVVLVYSDENAHNLGEIDKNAEKVSKCIRQAGFDARIIGSMDGEGISLRSLAEEAGLGFIGRSGLLITERFGPQVRLSGIFTNASLADMEKNTIKNGCRDCLICQVSCPSGAIELKSVEACTTYNTNLKEGRCTICIDLCPYSRR